MKSLIWMLGLLATGLGHAALATPVVIIDQTDVAATRGTADYGSYSSPNFTNTVRNGSHWGDEIHGVTRFDTSQVTVDRNAAAGTVRFDFVTRFSGTDPNSPARYADVFLNIANPTAFAGPYTYGIALGGQTQSAGLYALDTYATSRDVWSSRTQYVYGGSAQPNPSSSAHDPSIALAPPVRITTGTLLTDYSVAVGQTALGGGLFDVSVLITSVTGIDLFNTFALFWGTADCSNDAIWGIVTAEAEVPTPGAAWLNFTGIWPPSGKPATVSTIGAAGAGVAPRCCAPSGLVMTTTVSTAARA